jgi:uncharacterized protein (TIGR03435 family)
MKKMDARTVNGKPRLYLAIVWMGLVCPALLAQTPAAAPAATPASSPATIPLGADGKPLTFDIISFRRTETRGSQRVDMPDQGDSLGYKGQPIGRILYFAYTAIGQKIEGAPDWVNTELYDFQAKVAAEDIAIWQKTDLQARRLMVRKVLEDYTKLKMHPIDKAEPIYELVVAPGGPKLKEHVDGENKKFPDGSVVIGTDTHWTSPVEAYFQAATMRGLAEALSAHHTVERDVIDKTGLTAKYDFTLPVPYSPMSPEMLEQFNALSIFSEVQKLGLKLVPGKAISPGIVVDHIERPDVN